jgi:hypothetical protein
MKKFIFLYMLFSVFGNRLFCNDGMFYTRGNQLIPMFESGISIKKEILSITRTGSNSLSIVVYYEFFNPGAGKKVEVGFEAKSPSGDVNGTPVNGRHPYMENFTVSVNEKILPYRVSIVSDSVYYQNGKFIEKSVADAIQGIADVNEVNFDYVYHFSVNFYKGINHIKHTYQFKLSESIEMDYEFDYILTAATRWANKQIDDFTLTIDIGDFEDYYINNTFAGKNGKLNITGIGKTLPVKSNELLFTDKSYSRYILRKGFLYFHRLNFRPTDEISLFAKNGMIQEDPFDYTTYAELPFSISQANFLPVKTANPTSLKILKNLPFARRGTVFKDPALKQYFRKQRWYIPDVNYKPDLLKLTAKEKEWLKKLQ